MIDVPNELVVYTSESQCHCEIYRRVRTPQGEDFVYASLSEREKNKMRHISCTNIRLVRDQRSSGVALAS